MGFFRSRGKNRERKARGMLKDPYQTDQTSSENATSREPSPEPEEPTTHSESENSASVGLGSSKNIPTIGTSASIRQLRKLTPKTPIDIGAVPELLDVLETAKNTSEDGPALALRKLFALSEHDSFEENRTKLVRVDNGRLVPILLSFLERCCKGSEQYLALLVLNNVSIPKENKRLIALDHGGARILGRLLCDDPSCHLIAIVLVNLTFTDVDLRRELVSSDLNYQLVESLAFSLRVASLTQKEYELRLPLVENDPENPKTPSELLANLLAEDVRQRLDSPLCMKDTLARPCKQLFAETARWCLTAIKNLTRPSKDSTFAARALIHAGIVPHILRFITIPASNLPAGNDNNDTPDAGTSERVVPVTDNFRNAPSTWDSNSAQDAALFVILNLAAEPSAREYMREMDTVALMSMIIVFDKSSEVFGESKDTEDEKKIVELQCIKARMALAYLFGAEGHFGQPRARTSPSLYLTPDDSHVMLSEREATYFVNLLADMIHNRPRDGPGGYSAATFSLKYVLLAIRCLLTSDWNQILFANVSGPKLNALLMKALAQHSIEKVSYIDAEAAEHASFSLYLLSHYGFNDFLPASYANKKHTHVSLAAKVWTAYLQTWSITAPGKHAVQQLLLRLEYMVFEGSPELIAESNGSSMIVSDLTFSDELLAAVDKIYVQKITPGAKPRSDIFLRPILRSRPPTKGSRKGPWDNYAGIDSFPSALVAVHELSFASSKVRHINSIDDILIANNLAKSANGEKTESYNYMWSWQDAAGEINKNLERQKSADSFLNGQNETMSSCLGFSLGGLCAYDTTAN